MGATESPWYQQSDKEWRARLDARDTILLYSEWLDGNSLMRDPEDDQTHEELVDEFLENLKHDHE